MMQKKILIIGTEHTVALKVQKELIHFGYTNTVIASNRFDVFESIDKEKPDMILFNIISSDYSEKIGTVLNIYKKYNIPIIVTTDYLYEETVENPEKTVPFGSIFRSFTKDELYTAIDKVLSGFYTNKELKKRARWSSSILNSIQTGVIATNLNGLIEFINPAARKITNYLLGDTNDLYLDDIFRLIDSKTQTLIEIPVFSKGFNKSFVFKDTFIHNTKSEKIPIEGSIVAVIEGNGDIEGKVLTFRDITEKRKLSQTISYQAKHDILTGLFNRYWFSKILEELIDDAITKQKSHSFLYLDLDQFKVINEVCSHAAGDEMLLTTTNIINNIIRNSDICARLGGDEFGILLKDAHLQHAIFIAKRLQARLSESTIIRNDKVFNINTSIGIVMIDENSKDLHSVLAAADDACFISKDEGGKKFTIFNDDGNTFVKRRGEMQWISKVTKALGEHQFELFFQPIEPIDRDTVHHKRGEILIRMKDRNGKYISPCKFLPAAEKYKLMPAIDRWVINNALMNHKLLSDILGKDNNPYTFSINLSPPFLSDETSLDFIISKLLEFEIDPKNVWFEITETTAIGNVATATNLIQRLREIGCLFALDDFGSGFASFNYLKNLPIDFLKIDGIFVKDMDENSINRAMVKAINSIGQVIGLKTVAEFVQNPQIIEELKEIGVDYLQGYEIGKPESISKLIDSYAMAK